MGRIGTLELLLLIIPLLAIYFLPSIIALRRNKMNRNAIVLLNFFLGWTLIGWVVSFVWACASNNETQNVNSSNYSKEENLSPAANNDFDNKLDNLQKLKGLLDSGILSPEEFEQQKSKVLAS
ncbi:superinfection immunity protein [Flavobacterium aquicola]|uniref:Putative oligomerization/nucleic acid binding protein n=1 Tax=Flavobacterium aquicola TaxID=1682742 RepID=A0A3E0EH81_9FLAO|nr:superinfection immunity protein [Flavobacterium aquicola]REG96386.1 putative oligomerization/nucleic acid binding protein [Flavobacterium aquicola]